MKKFLLTALIVQLFILNLSKSETNHFGAGGIFELYLGESEIALTPKKEREQKLEFV
tara:strand:- start:73 stop:243 length:171 start_codon:yes stop_codon:yes gene_type:complete